MIKKITIVAGSRKLPLATVHKKNDFEKALSNEREYV
mgnify:CR=1 FL=1